jgi:hypothetical protein
VTEGQIESRVVAAIRYSGRCLGRRVWLADMAAGLALFHAQRPIPEEFTLFGGYSGGLAVCSFLDSNLHTRSFTGANDLHGVYQTIQRMKGGIGKLPVLEDAKLCWGLAVDPKQFALTVILYSAPKAQFSPSRKR